MNNLFYNLKCRVQAYMFSRKGNSKLFLELFKAGIFNISDEKLIDLYVKSFKDGFDMTCLSPLFNLNYNAEVLLSNHKILKLVTDRVVEDLNNSNIYFGLIYRETKVFESLKENPYFKDEMNKRVVLNSSKIDADIIQTMLFGYDMDKKKELINWLKGIGYKPFTNGFELDMVIDSGVMHSGKIGKMVDSLVELNLLDSDWILRADPKVARFISSFEELPFFSLVYDYIMEEEPHKASRFMNLYMTENGFTEEFYKHVKRYIFVNSVPQHMLFNINKYFGTSEVVLTPLEIQYYKHVSRFTDINFFVPIYDNIDKFFSEHGHTDELIKYLYKNSSWDALGVCSNLDPNEKFECLPEKDRKIITNYINIDDISLKKVYKEFVSSHKDTLTLEKIDFVRSILNKLLTSNSYEVYNFRTVLAEQLLELDDPIKRLTEIEKIFLKNNIPVVGKIYSAFNILHPDGSGFDFSDASMISPVLKKKSVRGRKVTVFSDLIKASFGSNNRSVIRYLDVLETGNNIYENIVNGVVKYEELDAKSKSQLHSFYLCIRTLYDNSSLTRTYYNMEIDNDVMGINFLKGFLSSNGDTSYNLADRAVSMFCHFAGFDTVEEVRTYIFSKVKKASERNIERAKSPMTFEKGDFVKGIGDIRYLSAILQNGSVAREYLGADAASDSTPLDTDLSMILDSSGSIENRIHRTAASSYGPLYFVLKNDERISITRDKDGLKDENIQQSQLEAFYTGYLGNDHYGIRTGFASSDIDYIVCNGKYDDRIGLELAMNGFYIPVVDFNGDIVFTPEQYSELRKKMAGLSYYGCTHYDFSPLLITEDVLSIVDELETNFIETEERKNAVARTVSRVLNKFGRSLKTEIDGDLSIGPVELIDTGSTSRGTNEVDGDFDYMMRLDALDLGNNEFMSALRHELLVGLGKEDTLEENEVTNEGDFRLKGATAENKEVDVDISFTRKTDKISYSTDSALEDRLNTIKRNYPDKYPYVVANIILAKRVLKDFEVYKPNRGDNPQGGLGGVGIENWVLQHGGSFDEAAISFLKASEGKNFEEFSNDYKILDFGENHMSEKKGIYSHDNFVNNMSKEGYEKMRNALRTYIEKRNITIEADSSKKR